MKGDKSKDIRVLFSMLKGHHPHVLVITLIGHLLVEHIIDKIVITKSKYFDKKFKKLSFAEKVELTYPLWLPLHIYKNIKLLNRIRNDMAHNLHVRDYELTLFLDKGEKKVLHIPSGKDKNKFYLNYLVDTILFELVNYSYYSLDISPEPDLVRIFNG